MQSKDTENSRRWNLAGEYKTKFIRLHIRLSGVPPVTVSRGAKGELLIQQLCGAPSTLPLRFVLAGWPTHNLQFKCFPRRGTLFRVWINIHSRSDRICLHSSAGGVNKANRQLLPVPAEQTTRDQPYETFEVRTGVWLVRVRREVTD